ncbi:hypothetical protein [Persephonella sp.]
MINLRIDEEALEHGIISLYTDDDVEIDEELSNQILLEVPCYDLTVSKQGELIELECDIEDLKKINPSLFKGLYSFNGNVNIPFEKVLEEIKTKSNLSLQLK